MKHVTFLLILIIFSSNEDISAQNLDWAWAKSYGGLNNDNCTSLEADNSGNIYMIGSFQSPSLTFDTITLNQSGSGSNFIVKFNSFGIAEWGKRLPYNCYARAISTDINGNVFITGTYFNTSPTFDTVTLVNYGTSDIFIVKYNASGNVLWAKSSGSINGEDAKNISVDNSGNVFVTGNFLGNSFTIGNVTLYNSGAGNTNDIFVASYDMDGNFIWAKSAGGLNNDRSSSIKVNNLGEVYVTGEFSSDTMIFESDTLINASSSNDVFIAMLDASSGGLDWATRAGGADIDVGYSIATDILGNAYICGEYYDAPATFGTYTLTNNGAADFFIVKYDRSGNTVWAKGFGGLYSDYPGLIHYDLNGNIYVTSTFYSPSINFGNNITITNPYFNSENMYVVKLNSTNGQALWGESIGGIDDEWGSSVTSDIFGNVFVAGNFGSYTISLDSIVFTNVGLTVTNDLFLAKLSTTVDVKESLNFLNSITVFPNPNNGNFIARTNVEIIEGEILIYNLLGEKIYSEIYNGKEINIASNLANGLYFVQIIDASENLSCKLLVE